MLDTIVMVNAIRKGSGTLPTKMNGIFAMARGTEGANAMEMTKWFNTNYHYIVPELDRNMDFRLNSSKITAEYKEARALGITPENKRHRPRYLFRFVKKLRRQGLS